MKLFSLLLFFIITIQYIQSKKPIRTYVVKRENKLVGKQLSGYTVYDSNEKNILYRLKASSTDIDTMILTNYPAKNMIANIEGEWVEKVFNDTFTIYDKKSNKYIDGTITIDSNSWLANYLIFWNSKHLNTKRSSVGISTSVFSTYQKELLAEFRYRYRTRWFSTVVKYQLKIYSDYVSDAIYFLLVAIEDHRYQLYT